MGEMIQVFELAKSYKKIKQWILLALKFIKGKSFVY